MAWMPGIEALSHRLRDGRTARALGALALAALIVLVVHLDATRSLPSDLLTVLPALGFALLMLVRPYLGAKAIARLHGVRSRARRVAARARPLPRRRSETVRGGRLIAAALAGRAPPALLSRAA